MSKNKKSTQPKADKPKKLNANQRIKNLELLVSRMEQRLIATATEIDNIGQIYLALSTRINAAIKASGTEDRVNQLILEQKEEELKQKVDNLVAAGLLGENSEENSAIVDSTFVVGRELDQNGNVVAPRIQFYTATLDQAVKDQLLGKKTGDVVAIKDTESSIEITKIYEVYKDAVAQQRATQAVDKQSEQPSDAMAAEPTPSV